MVINRNIVQNIMISQRLICIFFRRLKHIRNKFIEKKFDRISFDELVKMEYQKIYIYHN